MSGDNKKERVIMKKTLAVLMALAMAASMAGCGAGSPVSYTHLDVYKRQAVSCATMQSRGCRSFMWQPILKRRSRYATARP